VKFKNSGDITMLYSRHADGSIPLWRLSAGELAEGFAGGRLKPSVVLEAVLQRASVVDPLVNVFATRDDEGARLAAAASDRRWAQGKPLSRFDGVPISIKDNIEVKGLRCAWGSKLFLDHVPEADELPVQRLRAQGWVLLGKTNVSEFTLGRGNVDTLAFGTTRNPWNRQVTTGASTGGGAAAVATGIGPLALGTDGGGSIRWPAGYCDLVGLKPSTGRIARRGGLPAVLHDLEVIAPLGRTVGDVEALLEALSQPDAHDRASLAFRVALAPPEKPRPLRVLHVGSFGTYEVEPEITRSVDDAARRLASIGHVVERGEVPFDFALFDRYWLVFALTGVVAAIGDRPGWEEAVGAIYPPMAEKGRSFSSADYLGALDMARQVFDQMAQFFAGWDLLLTPVTGAMPRGAREVAPPYQRVFTGFANVAGLPAISLPGARTANGLPVGFQLVAAFGEERRLLTVARQYEAAFPWAGNWPDI